MNKVIFTGPSPRGWHRIQTFLECPQRFAFGHPDECGDPSDPVYAQLKAEGKPASRALEIGSLLHLGLAQHYARMAMTQQGWPADTYMAPLDAVRFVGGLQKSEHVEYVVECLGSYFDHYRFEDFEVVEVESLNEITFGRFKLTGRLDLAIRHRQTGLVYVMDHKSTSRYSEAQRLSYSLSGQFHTYEWMARQKYGAAFGGMKINFLQHTPPHKFVRVDSYPVPNLLRKLPATVVAAEEQIEAMLSRKVALSDWPTANSELVCTTKYGPCQYTHFCRFGA
jgi:hypothetical protein